MDPITRPAISYLRQLGADGECSLEDLQQEMDDRAE